MAERDVQLNEAGTDMPSKVQLTKISGWTFSNHWQPSSATPASPIGCQSPVNYSVPSKVLIIIVGFNNPGDVCTCLAALARSWPKPHFDVFIVENGGLQGADALAKAFGDTGGLLQERPPPQELPWEIGTLRSFNLRRDYGDEPSLVHVVAMPQNLGYAGAINACLRPMLSADSWHAIWILNPDTEPMPSALFELADHSVRSNRGMVGSKICAMDMQDVQPNCGLKWQKLYARTVAVPFDWQQDRKDLSAAGSLALDAPSGASIYVTRELIERIGLMDDRYFLYFEDLEWGCRAKRLEELSVSLRSVVRHRGGTTLGSAARRADRSRLSVYLEFRNRILFVKNHYNGWLVWTTGIQVVYIGAFLLSGSFDNMLSACRGLFAGLCGEEGKPTKMLAEHTAK